MAGLSGVRLETARLILRPPALEDLDRWAEMMAREGAARFVDGFSPGPWSGAA